MEKRSKNLRSMSRAGHRRFTGRIRFGPVSYILKDIWRNRSRTLMSLSSIAALAFLFVIFMSMDAGFQEFFEDDVGEPTEEEKELYQVKEVMENWVYLISGLCMVLMVLVIANTGIITVIERKQELATMRAMGIPMHLVSLIVAGSMAIILYSGLFVGTLLGLACIPLLDRVNVSLFSDGIGFPLAFDHNTLLLIIGIGTLAGIIGSALPLSMMTRSSPLEVLRDG